MLQVSTVGHYSCPADKYCWILIKTSVRRTALSKAGKDGCKIGCIHDKCRPNKTDAGQE